MAHQQRVAVADITNEEMDAALLVIEEMFSRYHALIIVEQMRLHCVFKGVTYELLKDKRFVEEATRAVPELGALYEEFQAAEATSARH